MILSPFTPLFFVSHKTDGIDSGYVQTFATTDKILIELIGNEERWNGGAQLVDYKTGLPLYQIPFSIWKINDSTYLRFASLTLNPGIFYVSLSGYGNSEPFRVIDDEQELENTTLIQYSMRNNKQRKDAVFFIDRMQYFFDFRVHGGFKDSNWSFSVDNEQFETPTADISQLYGLESTQKLFTLGGNTGVPVWFGEMLNRILVCSHVYFDGVKYSRKDASVPEMNVLQDGINSFVFKQTLQQSTNLDPVIEETNKISMRRINTDYRSADETTNRKI